MSFPQLLRRSAFAQHDPLITRIYSSTPSAISQTGDWGLKYPIHRQSPKYIKVANLDAGAAVGADWRSGEKEARFTETWGTGKVRWMRADQIGASKSASNYEVIMGDEIVEEENRLVPDLEAMTPGEFERYLDTVRKERGKFLTNRLKEIGREYKDEDGTLANLAAAGHVADADGAQMQASLIGSKLAHPQSKTLHAHPHPTGGLYYSKFLSTPSPALSYIDPRTTIPGRALNKKDRAQHRQDGIGAGPSPSETNTPFVVSVGGITGSATPYGGHDDAGIAETDYTRTSPQRGIAQFRVKYARLDTLPTVLNLRAREIAPRYGAFAKSQAKRAAPLDTTNFHVELEVANPPIRPDMGNPVIEPGSREWVGRAEGRSASRTPGDGLGRAFGGPRDQRSKGAAVEKLKAQRDADASQRQGFARLSESLMSPKGIINRPTPLKQR